MHREVEVRGSNRRIERGERSSRNGTCPKVGLHAAVALHRAPGKLIYKSRGAPRGERLLRRKIEQKVFCSVESRSKGMVLMGKVMSPSRAARLSICFFRSLLSPSLEAN